MKRIFLIRHGQSKANTNEEKYHTHCTELTEKGKAQAIVAGQTLANTLNNQKCKIYHSAFTRTRQTKNGILKHANHLISNVQEERFLAEMDFGYFDGIPSSEWAKLFPLEYQVYQRAKANKGKYWARMPGGESPLDVDVRLTLVRKKILDDLLHNDIDNIAVIGHGIALRIDLMNYLNITHEEFSELKNPENGSVQLLELHKGLWVNKGYL